MTRISRSSKRRAALAAADPQDAEARVLAGQRDVDDLARARRLRARRRGPGDRSLRPRPAARWRVANASPAAVPGHREDRPADGVRVVAVRGRDPQRSSDSASRMPTLSAPAISSARRRDVVECRTRRPTGQELPVDLGDRLEEAARGAAARRRGGRSRSRCRRRRRARRRAPRRSRRTRRRLASRVR